MSISDILTLVIALYGAIFSTILAVRQGRNRVAVRCDVVTLTTTEGKEYVVEVSAVNVGYRTLEIREVGLKDEYGTTLSKQFDQLSKLEPGMSIRQHFAYEDVLKNLDTFTSVFAEDSRRRSYSADMDDRRKDLIRYGPLLIPLITFGETVLRADKEFDKGVKRIEQQRERTLRRLDDIKSDQQKKVEDLQKEHQEWDEYRARTGKAHPDEQEVVDETLRYIHRAEQGDEGASEQREDDEQRQDS